MYIYILYPDLPYAYTYIYIYIHAKKHVYMIAHININACDVANPMPNLPFGDGFIPIIHDEFGIVWGIGIGFTTLYPFQM